VGTVRAPVDVGETVDGKYRVEGVIGAGAMGVVVAATHLALGQRVAIKFLLGSSGDAESHARFRREALALAKITSAHVAHVIDIGTLPDGASFMVMEHLEGEDLARVLRARGPIAPAEAVAWVREACEGLIEAHAAGIVHRDIKPANLFLARRRSQRTVVKILDFGIAKPVSDAGAAEALALTHRPGLLGSPLYMAPEQLRSARDVDERADIWALGVVLYELLTAKPPFMADSLGALVAAIQNEPPPPLQGFRTDVPAGLADVVRRCLEKDPNHRFPSVAMLSEALAPFGVGTRATGAPPPVSNLASTMPMPGPPRGASDEPRDDARIASDGPTAPAPTIRQSVRAPRRWVLAIPALAIALAIVGLSAVVRRTTPSRSAPPSSTIPVDSTPPRAAPLGEPSPVASPASPSAVASGPSPFVRPPPRSPARALGSTAPAGATSASGAVSTFTDTPPPPRIDLR